MKNWARNLDFSPKNIFDPKTSDELIQIVKDSQKIRLRGSAHSWTDLIVTDETFIQLDNLQGITEIDHEKKQITALAGTKLKLLGELAFQNNMAFPNQGDINKQSIAGALSTGTHGTGLTLKSMSNQITKLEIINAEGQRLVVDENHPYFNAARVSFGSLGLIEKLKLQMIDAYKLKAESFAEDMDQTLLTLRKRLQENRHVEMFYFPVGNWSIVKLTNKSEEQISSMGLSRKFNDIVLENWLYEGLNILANKTKSYKKIDKIMKKFVSPQVRVGNSHELFPTNRDVKFMEMEYNIPLESFEDAFTEIKYAISSHGFETLFPIEIRFVQADDIWLSPAYQRDSVYFAIHTYITEEYRPYFQTLEEIFKKYQGRPHWGKWNTANFDYLETVYPKWHEFLKVRAELDPKQKWANSYLKNLFKI